MSGVTSWRKELARVPLIYILAAAALIIVSLCVRLFVFGVVTSDYTYFVAQWFTTLQTHTGLTAFSYPFSDYAPLYLYVLKFLTIFPVSSLISVKILTLLCDAGMASAAYFIARKMRPLWSPAQALFAASIVFAIPTVLINSSLWGQSDVLYGGVVVVSFYFILRDNPRWAALSYAVALAIKLQAIFFLPVLVGFLLRTKERSKYLLLLPAVYIASIIPAWMGGGSPRDLLLVYAKQAGEYTALSVSAQNIFAFVTAPIRPSLANLLFWIGIACAGACAAWVAYAVYRNQTPERLATIALLCVLILPYLLPRMHERYFYLADVFSVLWAFSYPRRFWVPVLVILSSLLSYIPYLSSQVSWLAGWHIDLRVPSAMMLVAICLVGLSLLRQRSRAEAPAGPSVGPRKLVL